MTHSALSSGRWPISPAWRRTISPPCPTSRSLPTISLPKSLGEPISAMPPRSTSRAFILGSAPPASISLLSLSMISTGVFLGAPTMRRRTYDVERFWFGERLPSPQRQADDLILWVGVGLLRFLVALALD